MRSDGQQPWRDIMLRTMQSWRDCAAVAASDASIQAAPCADCARDRFLIVAQHGEDWPHWMQHLLSAKLVELRRELRASLSDSDTGDDHDAEFVDLWLRHALETIEPWPSRVLAAVERAAASTRVEASQRA